MEQQPTADGDGCSGATGAGVKTENHGTATKSRPKQNRRNRFEKRPRIKSDSDVLPKFQNGNQSERSHKKKDSAQFESREGASTKGVGEGNTEEVGRISGAPKNPESGGKKGPFPKKRVFTRRRASDSNAELQEAFNFLADRLVKVIFSKNDGETHCEEYHGKDERHNNAVKSTDVKRSQHESETETKSGNRNFDEKDECKIRGMKSDMPPNHGSKLLKKGTKKPFKKDLAERRESTSFQGSAYAHAYESSDRKREDNSPSDGKGTVESGTPAVQDSRNPELSTSNDSTHVVQPQEGNRRQRKDSDRRKRRQSRPNWLKPYVPFPPDVGTHATMQQNMFWPTNNSCGQKEFFGSRYNPYRIVSSANGRWNRGSGPSNLETRMQETSSKNQRRGNRSWRNGTYHGQWEPAARPTDYEAPERGKPAPLLQFFRSDMSTAQQGRSKKAYKRRDQPRKNDSKNAAEAQCPSVQSTDLVDVPQISPHSESCADANENVKEEQASSSALNETVGSSPDLRDNSEALADSNSETSLSVMINEEDIKDNESDPLSGSIASVVNEPDPSDKPDKPADEGTQRNPAVKKCDFGVICDAVIKEIEGKMNYRVNRVLRVMLDLLHPDARSLLDCLGVSCEEFYRLCSRFAKVDFSSARDLDITGVDDGLLQRLYEELGWVCRSLLVPLLSEKALLADSLINFSRLELDIIETEGIDALKELTMIFAVADDFRNVTELVLKDTFGWLDQLSVMKEIFKAFTDDDKHTLKQLGVLDTAESVVEKIELGIAISDKDITLMLRESMSSGFGEYCWLVERHPQLIRTLEHFECVMESIPQMEKCVDIRPLKCTLMVIPILLGGLSQDERDRCVARHLAKHNLVKGGRSWAQLLRNASSIEQLVMELLTQFFFCSTKCGAEEFLGALLENIPLDKKIQAIKSIGHFPPCLRDVLLSDPSNEASLYAATKRMAEEMPVFRFKKDAVFLISNLCEHSSLSPSELLSKVFFPMMSTPARGKAALAISSLVKHRKFKEQLADGSTISLSDLIMFALGQYEVPSKTTCNSRYAFIESIFIAVRELLLDNKALAVNFAEIFQNLEGFTWYQKVAVSLLFCEGIDRVRITYPWNDGDGVVKNLRTLRELPLILTSWPGDNSGLFESFIKDNFCADDADLLSQVMLLALDRDEERIKEDVHTFANSIYGLSGATPDWEELLLEFEKKNEIKVSEGDGANSECSSSNSRSHENHTIKDSSNTMSASESSEIRADVIESSSDAPTERSSKIDENPSEKYEATNVSKQSMPPVDAQSAIGLGRNGSGSLLTENVPADRNVTTVKATEDDDLSQVKSCISDLLERLEMIGRCDESTGSPASEYEECQTSILAVIETSSKSKHEQSERKLGRATADSREVPLSQQEDDKVWNTQVQKFSEDDDWDSIGITEPKVDRNLILQDLRTFTWALDTLEKWTDCPPATKEKVLLMALNCRCDLVKIRARKIKEDASLNK